jgi:hypothetical protein
MAATFLELQSPHNYSNVYILKRQAQEGHFRYQIFNATNRHTKLKHFTTLLCVLFFLLCLQASTTTVCMRLSLLDLLVCALLRFPQRLYIYQYLSFYPSIDPPASFFLSVYAHTKAYKYVRYEYTPPPHPSFFRSLDPSPNLLSVCVCACACVCVCVRARVCVCMCVCVCQVGHDVFPRWISCGCLVWNF